MRPVEMADSTPMTGPAATVPSLGGNAFRLAAAMLARRGSFAAAVGLAVLMASACATNTRHYSADRFKRCMMRQHAQLTFTHDASWASTVALVVEPRFAEWVYFFKTTEAASAARKKLQSETGRNRRVLRQLLRAQRSNALVFAPAQQDWFAPIKHCLDRSRV